MKTLVAGSRGITDEGLVRRYIREATNEGEFEITELVSGTADGVDTIAEEWAEENDIPIDAYPYEDFTDSSKPAPLARNDKMRYI